MAHELRLYQTASGRCPVREYLRAQGKAVRGGAGWLLTRLERPIADYLEDGIYELRVVEGRRQHRIRYFFAGRVIVATNAFLKKTARVPRGEIDRAVRARADWREREAKR